MRYNPCGGGEAVADLKPATDGVQCTCGSFQWGSAEPQSPVRLEKHYEHLEFMAGAACSGMPWSLGLEGPGWGCVGCRRWPSQHTRRSLKEQRAGRSFCIADVQVHVSREQLKQGACMGAPRPHMLARQAKSLEGGLFRRVGVAQESKSLVGCEGGWWTAVCLLSLAQCGWTLWASSQVQQGT